MKSKSHLISTIVEHQPGVLGNITHLFRRRGFNIKSITVGHSGQKDLARMTIAVDGDKKTVEQVVKHLNKLVDVIKVCRLDPQKSVARELAIVKILTQDHTRTELVNCVNIFRAQVVDASPEALIVEITGTPEKIDAFLHLMKPFNVQEIARTGIVALTRGFKLNPNE